MPRLIWSDEALADVERLHRFLLPKSEEAAARAVKAVFTGMRSVARHPHIGRLAEAMTAEYREKVIPFGGGSYIALYRWDGQQTVVLAVRHNREVGYAHPPEE
jgi:plasmid stabilization system protein ParE